MTPVFLDANIPMYAVGKPHRFKQPAIEILSLAALNPAAFFSNAEVLQEIIHRYRAQNTWPSGRVVFDRFASLMEGRIEPMLVDDVLLAAELAERYPALSARDLVHAAVMHRVGASYIVSADEAFDVLDDIERLDPLEVDGWRERVLA